MGVDFSEMVAEDDSSTTCLNLAPWLGTFWDGSEYNVYCHAPKGHLGMHGGNGWSWPNEIEKDDYPVMEQEVLEAYLENVEMLLGVTSGEAK